MVMSTFVFDNHINMQLFYYVQFALMEEGRREFCLVYAFLIPYSVLFIFFQVGLLEELFPTW